MSSPTPRLTPTQVPLEFVATPVMRWEDLPGPLRDRVREQLAALLQQIARQPRRREERRDDA